MSCSSFCCSRARRVRRPEERARPRTPARWAFRNSFRRATASYAIDGNGDGKRDLWSSWEDVISSVANYLRVHGWREGEPVVAKATLADKDLSRFNTEKLELNEDGRLVA